LSAGREADPREVRDEQEGRPAVDPVERDDRRDDEREQESEDDEPEVRAFEPPEDGRPRDVDGELGAEQPERDSGVAGDPC